MEDNVCNEYALVVCTKLCTKYHMYLAKRYVNEKRMNRR